MTDATAPSAAPASRPGKRKGSLLQADARTKRRNAAEMRFRVYGMIAIGVGLAFLLFLMSSIISNGTTAFYQTSVRVDVPLDPEVLDPEGNANPEEMRRVTTFSYKPLVNEAVFAKVQNLGIETPLEASDMGQILSDGAASAVRNFVLANPDRLGETVQFDLLTSSRVDGYMKDRVTRDSIARDRFISAEALDLVDAMEENGSLAKRFNWSFVTGADASDNRPEQAGFGVSMAGSFFMMLVVLFLSLPIGVAASIYLEEFAPKNRLTDFIEVNISNLAAIPSIVFGILGLAVFIQFMHLPQSAPLVGGLVLTLMTLPTIIISTRASLKAVPPSIRDAALGVGASKMQSVFHHVLPLAMPGILTGTIIGLAQALGETAPLLLIGMVGFIATNYPQSVAEGFLSPNSAMPAQIYEWAKRADPAFYERAYGGIIILLVFLLSMNILAIILRRRFERRW